MFLVVRRKPRNPHVQAENMWNSVQIVTWAQNLIEFQILCDILTMSYFPPFLLSEHLCELLMKINVLSLSRYQIPLTPSEVMFPSHVFPGILYIAWLMPPTLASSCHIHSASNLSISCQPSQVLWAWIQMILHTQNIGKKKKVFEINIQLMKLLMPGFFFFYLLFLPFIKYIHYFVSA